MTKCGNSSNFELWFNSFFYRPMEWVPSRIQYLQNRYPIKFFQQVKIRFDSVDLLLYPKFLNNGLTLQAPRKSYIKNNFPVGLGKIFQSN